MTVFSAERCFKEGYWNDGLPSLLYYPRPSFDRLIINRYTSHNLTKAVSQSFCLGSQEVPYLRPTS